MNPFKMLTLGSSLTSAPGENNENETSNKQPTVQSSDQAGQSSSLPTNNASSDQVKSSGIELAMPWNTRDNIVHHLSQFSKLLFRQSVSKELKENAVKQTNSLMTALIGLASNDTQTSDEERPAEKVRIDKAGKSDSIRPFFLIPLRLRTEVIDQLVRNMDAVCYEAGSPDESSRNRLREQNDRLNLKLLSLPITHMSIAAADESDSFELPANLDTDLNKLNRKLAEAVMASQSEQSTLTSEFQSLRESMQKLEAAVQGMRTNSEITINYELIGAEAFFASNTSRRFSKLYTCGGTQWSINLIVMEQEEGGQRVKNLGFFLRCERPTDANEQWSIGTCYDLILLSPSNNVVRQMRYNRTFKWTDKPPSYGAYIISYDDLKRSNYIQNDRIKVRVELKCDQLVVG